MQRKTGSAVSMCVKFALVAIVVTAAAAVANAFINPNFTPVHLVEQSDLVLVLKFEGEAKDGKVKATVQKALKGEAPKKPLTFDFFAGAFEAQGKAVVRMIADGNTEALFFVGFFEDEAGGGDMELGGDEEEGRGMLHIGGKWIALSSVEERLWDMEKIDSRMLGTWAGSTDMLLRAVHYVLTTDDADVPIKSNVEWGRHVKLGTVKGKIAALTPVDLAGDGKLTLFVASDAGDKLFRCEGGKLVDVTAKHGLTSKSKVACWADFNDDGKADFMSSGGSSLKRYLQNADGTFGKPDHAKFEARDISDLAVLRAPGGEPRLVVGTSAGVRFFPEKVSMRAPTKGDGTVEVKSGPGGRYFVADFDGDALPDILRILSNGAFLYKGTAPGVFAAPVKTQIGLGKGQSTAQLGDYDADGLLDIFVSAEDRNRIWHNLGKGKFVEMLEMSGEIAYISKSGGIDGMTGDINNDGRQDILIAYDGMTAQIFFNRGFRSFGHAHMIDLAELKLLPEAGNGQQAGCLADLNGDGAQDMVLALKNGELWFFPRRIAGDGALSVTAAIARGKKLPQPVTVAAFQGERALGVWSITEGSRPAFFGLQEAGPVTLKWRFPGARPQTKKVRVIDKPVRVLLSP